jgi:hypothetical protein
LQIGWSKSETIPNRIENALIKIKADLAKNRKRTATNFNKIEREVADYFIPQSWTILEEAKTIVEHAIENPASDIEALLHDLLHKGISKTLTEINDALNNNKSLSDETKAIYRKDVQVYVEDVYKWMISAYGSKTLLYPTYKFLETRQRILFERISNLTNKTGQNSSKVEEINLLKRLNASEFWNCPNFRLLRDIDSDPTGKGIDGDKEKLKRLKEYLNRNAKKYKDKQPDTVKTLHSIVESLYFEDGKIKTKLRYRSMFSE